MSYALASSPAVLRGFAQVSEVPQAPELEQVSGRVDLLVQDLEKTTSRLFALKSRLLGAGAPSCSEVSNAPSREGKIGEIKDRLDRAGELSVFIDTIISDLERIG